jgi:hypothetical protein
VLRAAIDYQFVVAATQSFSAMRASSSLPAIWLNPEAGMLFLSSAAFCATSLDIYLA